jgi:hypothetical protein
MKAKQMNVRRRQGTTGLAVHRPLREIIKRTWLMRVSQKYGNLRKAEDHRTRIPTTVAEDAHLPGGALHNGRTCG